MQAERGGLGQLAIRSAVVVAIVLLAAVVALLVWQAVDIVFLAFLGLLLALFLLALADFLADRTGLPSRWSLVLVVVGLACLGGLAGWLLAPQLAQQLQEAAEQLPQLQEQVQRWLERHAWGRELLASGGNGPQLREIATPVGKVLGMASDLVVGVVVVGLLGLFFAAQPELYRKGSLLLVPRGGRARAAEVLSSLATALRWFLIGRALAMTLVGLSTWVVLWLLDIRLAALLGLIVGLLTFVPYLGPLVGAVPIAAAALPEGVQTLALVLASYAVIQWLEGYVLDPLIQQRVVRLPPAITLAAQVLGAALGGTLGVAVATPLALVVLVLVQSLYVRGALKEEIRVAGGR